MEGGDHEYEMTHDPQTFGLPVCCETQLSCWSSLQSFTDMQTVGSIGSGCNVYIISYEKLLLELCIALYYSIFNHLFSCCFVYRKSIII